MHGMIYFLAIPSMYMLLMMYALTNLHIVSWGTREVKPTKSEAEQAAVSLVYTVFNIILPPKMEVKMRFQCWYHPFSPIVKA